MPAMGHLVQMAHQAGIGLAAAFGYIQVPEAVLFQADFSVKPVDIGRNRGSGSFPVPFHSDCICYITSSTAAYSYFFFINVYIIIGEIKWKTGS